MGHSVSANGVKLGHTHALAHILKLVPEGKSLEELRGNAVQKRLFWRRICRRDAQEF